MSKSWKGKALRYGITTAVGLLMVLLFFLLRGEEQPALAAMAAEERYRALCDAFTIPGAFIFLAGSLVWVSNEGAFDGLGYALSIASRTLIPGKGRQKVERYSDYLERKHGKKVVGFGFLFLVGLGFLAVALVFLLLYQSVC